MITVEQIRAARAMLGLNQSELAHRSGISAGLLYDIEQGAQNGLETGALVAIQDALEAEGIEFSRREDGGFGIYLKPAIEKKQTVNLLIIDDSEADRALYKAWLKKSPTGKKYSVIEADNAKDGYDAFLRRSPACIILDYHMHGKDGFELLAQMKKEQPEIPSVIFATAFNSEKMVQEVRNCGAFGYLDKNRLTREMFVAAIDRALVV